MTLIELLISMRGANREEMFRLAKNNPEWRCDTRNEFIDIVQSARIEDASIGDGGALGDNFAGLDEIINLAGSWRRASRRADAEEERAGVEVVPSTKKVYCQRCKAGSEGWFPRVVRPAVCPYCHSARWDTPRTVNEPGRKPRTSKNQYQNEDKKS